MRNILLPVDGSDSAFQAALYVIDSIRKYGPMTVHLVNVQPKPMPWQTIGMEPEDVDAHLSVQAHVALKAVQHLLNEEGVEYLTHVKLGDVGETVVALADELDCDHIIMGTRGLGAILGMVLGSATRKVLYLAEIPVVCVKSEPSRTAPA